jgi:hypothetical protein
MNVCPVYERTGHAYGSVYPGPIGAVLTPQLTGWRTASADSGGGVAPAEVAPDVIEAEANPATVGTDGARALDALVRRTEAF